MSDTPEEATVKKTVKKKAVKKPVKNTAVSKLPQDVWLSTTQVCKWLQVDKDWLYDQVRKNEIPCVKVGRLLRFHRQELTAWIESGRK